MQTDNFDVWLDEAPVVSYGDQNFNVWLDDAPVAEPSDEITPPVVFPIRRRVFIF